ETGYLPFLITKRGKSNFDELIPRSDNGTAERPDKNNISSYVRIIDQSSDQIVVHWRYMPDLNNVGFTGVVHEYFFVKPDGTIKREIKQGSFDLVNFNDPENRIVQDLKINNDKLEVISIKKAQLSKNDIAAIDGNPVKTKSVIQPGYWWKFDEGLNSHPHSERTTTIVNVLYKESESSANGAFMATPCSVSGNKALWKKGVSGTALAFDGYHSSVSVQAPHILPEEIYSWSMEAWVALGAYPWLWGSVFELTENDHGIRFGISDLGQVGFTYKDAQTEFEIISESQIPLYQWTQVGAVYDKEKKEVRLYIDGKQVAHKRFDIVQFLIPETELSIGLNKTPLLTTEHVSRDYPPDIRTPEGNQPMIYGIEGLIGELKIYDAALDEDQFRQAYQILKSSEKLLQNPDLEKRMLPGEVDGQNSSKFGAYYTNLKYHDLWDNLWRSSDYPDIVVRFDDLPTSVVYWRGTNYGPGWVTENNIWMSDQSCEIYHEYGCAEHMADKQNRHSHVRIIENHDARILIHWRYASVDILYNFE
ncbi:LamG domain-containing protein, partial [bacterium]|nr:LamG domain-containing protein [bacterium]